MVAWRRFVFALALLASPLAGASVAFASDTIEVAQAQTQPQAQPAPEPSPSPAASPTPAADAQPAEEPIGNVATVTGIATVIRDKNSYPLKVRDDIYLNDIVQTASNSSLGITFNDSTTFNLSASAKITIDNYVYEDGGKQNAAIFDIGKGTVAFVAAAVAKTGDMKITTPTATLGIRGTTGVVDVPATASTTGATANNVNIKLYPDADGRVGHIDVNDRTSGTRLGVLTQGSSGFAIRPGAGGPGGVRFAAVPITIAPQQVARDRAFVTQVHLAQTTGRQIVTEQRDFRRANPTASPRIPRPLQQQRPAAPGQQPQRPNGLPGQNRPGQQQPGTPNRQGPQQPQRQGTQPSQQRQGQGGAVQPGTPRTGQGQQGQQQGAGQPAGVPRAGQGTQPRGAPQAQPPRNRQPPSQPGGATPPQPGRAPQPQTPRSGLQPPPAAQQPGGVQRQDLQQRLPGAPRKPAPAPKEKKERR
ncbi:MULTISPECIES: FecR domain-containing protein [unclassified Bradyrhizobium]|uniref:FecR family protein n=1 Tax=unclassified Bradyrhizobium TaxID=2631580 RepID=UPI0024784D8D|nr:MULTISPECIES: FecR domain-containing protein [unclassified Bradyrhizobium]WGR75236.1 FecR domain-containing protein [Bradyrhizobium sp. ISRA426]WGR82737.1 FecR domain-containing protein [Bradyrhizobium sp. ISRA430]WGR90433.1 FecR domain-containing protein [Bradyrhizobium sp. ISRA432]